MSKEGGARPIHGERGPRKLPCRRKLSLSGMMEKLFHPCVIHSSRVPDAESGVTEARVPASRG